MLNDVHLKLQTSLAPKIDESVGHMLELITTNSKEEQRQFQLIAK
jgi:hypothetical protein